MGGAAPVRTGVGAKLKSPRVTIALRAEDINVAKRGDSGHCMIAEAIKRAVPTAQTVAVDLATIRWTDKALGLRYVYLTPYSAQQVLIDFDKGETNIDPISFRLRNAMIVRSGRRGERRDPKKPTLPKKATLITGREGDPVDTGRWATGTRVGGKLPPQGALSNRTGRRRSYGLRAAVK